MVRDRSFDDAWTTTNGPNVGKLSLVTAVYKYDKR